MSTNWKWKVGLLVFLTLLSVYFLLPTLYKTKIEEDKAANKVLPWYYSVLPDKFINLGLDLRGGIYLEFEVLTNKALLNQIDLLSEDLKSQLTKAGFTDVDKVSFTPDKDEATLTIASTDSKLMDKIVTIITSREYSAILTRPVRKNDELKFGYDERYLKNFRAFVIEQAVAKVRNRIDRYGVAEPTIQRLGSGRIAVELPGLKDPERAINIIKQAGQLEFKIVDNSVPNDKLELMIDEARKENEFTQNDYTYKTVEQINKTLALKLPKDTEIAFELKTDQVTQELTDATPFLLKRKVWITGDMLKDAKVSVSDNEPHVSLTLDNRGAKLFGEVTSKNIGERMAILLDNTVISAPTIQSAIYGGQAMITMGRGSYEVLRKRSQDLVLVLQEGALPAPLVEATKTVVGPSLGADSIHKGIIATLIGGALVFIFMLVYYKVGGLLADLALGLNLLFILAALVPFQATLTLPGIAGIVLTLGMAVDANVLILERIKEELRLGRSAPNAVKSGYHNAMRTIIDANITTLIAALVLYQFGTGPIKGFAVTLGIGLVISMYTACVCTRMVYDIVISKFKLTTLKI
ncbi:MAG: protein translocase subunit SecD [Pseudomonadota bacterium]